MSALVNIDAGAVIGALRDGLDRFFPSPEEKAKAVAVLDQIAARPDEAQIEIDKIEAGSASLFVAGWRPFVGWVCGVGCGYQFLLRPLANGVAAALGHPGIFDSLDTSVMMQLLTALLGLGAARMVEKLNNAAGNH